MMLRKHGHHLPRFTTLLAAPFAAVIYADATYSAVHLLLSDGFRKVLAEEMPMQEVLAVAVFMAVGGILSIIGMLIDNPRIERGGLALLVVGLALYAITVLFAVSLSQAGPGFDLALCAAGTIRFYRLGIGAKLRVRTHG